MVIKVTSKADSCKNQLVQYTGNEKKVVTGDETGTGTDTGENL
jgi:hypothetical protein